MVSTPDQRRRYRKRHPEIIKAQNKRYIEKKLKQKLKGNPSLLMEMDFKIRLLINKLTRLKYGDLLPNRCKECGSVEDLQIHHKRYSYPIELKDLVRLCRGCHVLEHQRTTPTLWSRGDSTISDGTKKER